MKAKRILALGLAVVSLFVTGCQNAPDEVKKENEILNNKVNSDGVALEFATLEEIRNTYEEQNKNNSTNIQVGYVRVSQGDSMPSYTVKKRILDGYPDYSDLVEYVYGEKVEDHPESVMTYSHTEEFPGTDCSGCFLYVPNEEDIMSRFITWDCGGIAVTYNRESTSSMEGYPIVKMYQIFMGDTVGDDSYVMTDGKELKVSDAISTVEDFCNNYFSPMLNNEFHYSVKELFVHQYDDGTYGYNYDMEYTDVNGNIIGSCIMRCRDLEGFDEGTVPYVLANDCHGYVFDTDKTHMTAYQESTPVKGDETDKGEQLLTYESALEVMSNRLATAKQYDFDIASLEYLVVYPAEPGYLTRDERGDLNDLNISKIDHDNERTYEVRPYWVFRDFEKNTTSEAHYGGFIIVDALTGEVSVY